jgi:hypothetical protein
MWLMQSNIPLIDKTLNRPKKMLSKATGDLLLVDLRDTSFVRYLPLQNFKVAIIVGDRILLKWAKESG